MSQFHRRLPDVDPRMNHREARALFLALADDELPAPQAQAVRTHLDGCDECRHGWEGYSRTVQRVRGVQKEKAPPALASLVMTRVRRQRRFGLKGLHMAHMNHRFPVEILIPLLLAAAVAAFLVMAAP
ncbi:zf-HC2 domain-containing protein [Myxococcus sp. MISCRS1]|uniref:anti-sigma factor family protein n=1 Tax=Myxococcus TaxID=32 RepID=UPI001141FA21|nr:MULTISPECIES: zf-HC2 domain-containing protein [Myxococcus]BDT35870.1 zf-HC2 domain-containing protein [Myxococcus sp. MH1]MBZ4401835.1 zf-HC2 domain-containing protein [Myxococcus sp. AS-1-15]MBZ4407358.1 zf-HC2 domain-containing protein [Myxococcus sp. XM-1-1-1]MCK8500334.1 zf-HC2 domain-containing protein [Myxococcus fulvus]MCY1002562.1 zf-HC2 domain-containing protein [Myxococcus sp. MISCRS1]